MFWRIIFILFSFNIITFGFTIFIVIFRVKGNQLAPDREGGTQLIPINENYKEGDSFENDADILQDFQHEDGFNKYVHTPFIPVFLFSLI